MSTVRRFRFTLHLPLPLPSRDMWSLSTGLGPDTGGDSVLGSPTFHFLSEFKTLNDKLQCPSNCCEFTSKLSPSFGGAFRRTTLTITSSSSFAPVHFLADRHQMFRRCPRFFAKPVTVGHALHQPQAAPVCHMSPTTRTESNSMFERIWIPRPLQPTCSPRAASLYREDAPRFPQPQEGGSCQSLCSPLNDMNEQPSGSTTRRKSTIAFADETQL